jgi:hypothetical protein
VLHLAIVLIITKHTDVAGSYLKDEPRQFYMQHKDDTRRLS